VGLDLKGGPSFVTLWSSEEDLRPGSQTPREDLWGEGLQGGPLCWPSEEDSISSWGLWPLDLTLRSFQEDL
jgi:hypothetical protein